MNDRSRASSHQALVVGAGASGTAATRLLLALGAQVNIYDRNPDTPTPIGARGFFGEASPPTEAWTGVDLVVLSPGVPPGPIREEAANLAPTAEITGEMAFGLTLLHRGLAAAGQPIPVVLITGTNGKSTVTALVGDLLRAGGYTPFVGGNLGTPLCAGVLDLLKGNCSPWHQVVLECSSFQLETMPDVPVQVGMVLNVTPDHLDRYPNIETYADTKAAVFTHLQAGGLALVDDGGPYSGRITPTRTDITVTRIGREGEASILGDGPGHTLVLRGEHYPRKLLRLPGRHNSSNALFALAAARHLGVDPEQCRRGLAGFEGLPHRMAFVRELGGVRWYNDSKATNVASALASLGGLAERFVLIAGGRRKADDLGPLAELLARRARGLVAIGESGEEFMAAAGPSLPTKRARDMAEAVAFAQAMAQAGDAVVLAPACASYDQFRSYAHRGEVFAAAVLGLDDPARPG